MSTPSSSHSVGISFREVMSGGFVLGATDPADGEKRGRAEGSEMTMHGAIDIDDIDRFIAEADHPGTLTGTLDFTPFGDGLAAVPGGIFNLFSPTDDPKLKLMVYEMGFQHGGKSYYLAGQKDVRQDPIFDLLEGDDHPLLEAPRGDRQERPGGRRGDPQPRRQAAHPVDLDRQDAGIDLVHRVVGGDRQVR